MNISAKMRYLVWLPETKIDVQIKVLLFLISPFFGFLYALKRIKTKSSFVIFFMFALCFGMAFSPDKRGAEAYIDGQYYVEEMPVFASMSNEYFYNEFQKFLAFDDGSKDYYYNTVAFYVSRFTDNYHVMFMLFAVVFAFFQLKTFRFFTAEENFNNSLICILLAFLFTYNQIFNINGMRFWTAAWIGVYCIFQIFFNNNKKYFLLVFCTPFFHGSFWVYIAVIVLAYLVRKYEKAWIVLFFISFIFSSFAIELIQNTIDYLPPFLARLVGSYTSYEAILSKQQEGTGFWMVGKIFNIAVKVYINLLVCLLIKNNTAIKNIKTKSLYQFLLVWMTFVNFVMPIPSLGNRFIILAYPIIAYLWLGNLNNTKYRYWIYAIPLVFFMGIYSLLEHYISVLDFSFYFSSPLILIIRYLLLV